VVDGDVQDFKVNLVKTNKHPLMTNQFIIQDQATVDQISNVQPYISSGEEIGENHIVNEQLSMVGDSLNPEAQDREVLDTNTRFYLEEEMSICQVGGEPRGRDEAS